jgi:hypothetical protein
MSGSDVTPKAFNTPVIAQHFNAGLINEKRQVPFRDETNGIAGVDNVWKHGDFCRPSSGLGEIRPHLDPALKRRANFKGLACRLSVRWFVITAPN